MRYSDDNAIKYKDDNVIGVIYILITVIWYTIVFYCIVIAVSHDIIIFILYCNAIAVSHDIVIIIFLTARLVLTEFSEYI
jgi:hypothetical protein